MIERRQQAYLEAMGIQLWSPRQAQEIQAPLVQPSMAEPVVDQKSVTTDAGGLKLGAGSGGILLVCAVDSDSASKLANDISRSLGNVPVWGWPDLASDARIRPDSWGIKDAILNPRLKVSCRVHLGRHASYRPLDTTILHKISS